MTNQYTLGYKTNLGSLVELEFNTLEEAVEKGSKLIFPKIKFEFIKSFRHMIVNFIYKKAKVLYEFDISKDGVLTTEEVNKFFKALVANQYNPFHEQSFKFVNVKHSEDEFILTFDFFHDDEDRFETVDYCETGLINVFAYAMKCLFPECSFEFTLEGNTLKYTYQGDTEDDQGEDEIEYSIETMNKYIKDFIENNETGISNMIIGNWTKFLKEQEESRIAVLNENSDIPF